MAEPPKRRPLKGSCHCGAIQYIVFLTLPHSPVSWAAWMTESPKSQVFFKCNCTSCHKAGLLHVRLPFAPDDFMLLSPLDPLQELGDYQCFGKRLHFLFCRTCGGRCFTFMGKGELVDVELEALGVKGTELGQKTTVWRPKKEGWSEGMGAKSYLSVNAYSIDADQAGFDLREWTEKKWIDYIDFLEIGNTRRPGHFEAPHEGGAY